MAGSFRFLDAVALADMAFEAVGGSLPELFDAATQALIESVADPATVGQTRRQTIDLEEPDLAVLLFEWLGRLVHLKDAKGMVFHRINLSLTQRPERSLWHLHAEVIGAPVDPATQDLRSDVKGVTKHLYAVTQDGSNWTAKVVLDV
ncbi:MAG: Archease [Nitrospira sp.]|jgi:SHS2 domain-containing protein|nr:MAG: Archease [Nitrospira sp.]